MRRASAAELRERRERRACGFVVRWVGLWAEPGDPFWAVYTARTREAVERWICRRREAYRRRTGTVAGCRCGVAETAIHDEGGRA